MQRKTAYLSRIYDIVSLSTYLSRSIHPCIIHVPLYNYIIVDNDISSIFIYILAQYLVAKDAWPCPLSSAGTQKEQGRVPFPSCLCLLPCPSFPFLLAWVELGSMMIDASAYPSDFWFQRLTLTIATASLAQSFASETC